MSSAGTTGSERPFLKIVFRAAEAAGGTGTWEARAMGAPVARGATFEECLRRAREALAGRAGRPEAFGVRIDPCLVMDPEVLDGRIHLEGTRISLERLLETLAAAQSFEAALEHFPILCEEDLADALAFAARALGGLRAGGGPPAPPATGS